MRGVHSWEQSVDPYDSTGHGSRPVRNKDLKPHEYDASHSEMCVCVCVYVCVCVGVCAGMFMQVCVLLCVHMTV